MVKTVMVNLKKNSYIDANKIVVRQLTKQEQKTYKGKVKGGQNESRS